jgi:AraC family transcriptional regulator, regulatory protein of adaptative response / methylated-DNA-[protein]-cysteine methyltransferase
MRHFESQNGQNGPAENLRARIEVKADHGAFYFPTQMQQPARLKQRMTDLMSIAIDKLATAVALVNAQSAERDVRWAAVLNRDRQVDGQFVYAVKTTGVYCRPTCASRRPKPANVAFYDTCDDAEHAGFRACQRCLPRQGPLAQQHASIVAAACRKIERADGDARLEGLALAAGMSPFHFHRLFKSITGLTPKAYGDARRAMRIRDGLTDGGNTVTSAIYGAGFNSNSRFYEKSNSVLGMTPTAFRSGGAGVDIKFAVGKCSLGSVLVAASAKGICAILLADGPDELARDLRDCFPNANLIGGDVEFDALVAKVVDFVERPALGLNLALDVRGTAFQRRVWQALRDIPAGKTVSYDDLASQIGAPKAMRAVAQAGGANNIAVAIPCHRVVRAEGLLRAIVGASSASSPCWAGRLAHDGCHRIASRLSI